MKVVLIEDQNLLSGTLKKALEQMEDMQIVAQSDSADEALQLCEIHQPDLVIMDIFTREGNGIECTARIKRAFPSIKVLVFTGVEDDHLVRAAQDAGADLFARKSLSLEEFTQLIQYASKPYRVFPITQIAAEKPIRFSDMELSILSLLAQGKSTKEIAAELFLGYGTVRVYISQMYASTGLKSRAQLVTYALCCGLINSRLPV